MSEEMSLIEKLLEIQTKLKAPKGQWNKFGKYNYRSQEDILEAVKPLNKEYGLVLYLTDEPVLIGDWHYIKASAVLRDVKTGKSTEVNSYAREPLNKKGMDESQITGTASSYARKYALNGLYLIDDTKDSDTNEHSEAAQNVNNKPVEQRSNSNSNYQNQNNQQRPNNQQQPQEPTPQQQEKELTDLIVKYVKELTAMGIDINQLYSYIAKKEGVMDIREVAKVQVLGYLKAQHLKIKNNQTKQQQQQGSILQDRSTQPATTVTWGSK